MRPLANFKADARALRYCQVHMARAGLPISFFHLLESNHKSQMVVGGSLKSVQFVNKPITIDCPLYIAIAGLESHIMTTVACEFVRHCWHLNTWLGKKKNINLHRIQFKTSMSAASLLSEQSLTQVDIVCRPIQLIPSLRQGRRGSTTNLLLQRFKEPLYLHVKHYSMLALSSHRCDTPQPSRDRFVRSGPAKKWCHSDTLFLAGSRFFVWQKTRITGPETDLMEKSIPPGKVRWSPW